MLTTSTTTWNTRSLRRQARASLRINREGPSWVRRPLGIRCWKRGSGLSSSRTRRMKRAALRQRNGSASSIRVSLGTSGDERRLKKKRSDPKIRARAPRVSTCGIKTRFSRAAAREIEKRATRARTRFRPRKNWRTKNEWKVGWRLQKCSNFVPKRVFLRLQSLKASRRMRSRRSNGTSRKLWLRTRAQALCPPPKGRT